jgi:orotate phosphoribosyltransferase
VNSNEISDIFKKTGALQEGHFVLTSGLHSNTYFQCALVLQYPEYCQLFAHEILKYFSGQDIDVVIAPAVGGIVLAQELGRQLNKRTIFAERQDGSMTLRRGFKIDAEEKVLVCEDVVTTGGSVREVLALVMGSNAVVAGVGFIVDRSTVSVDFGVKQFSLYRMPVETFTEQNCPLCQKNVPLNKPGSRNI